MRYVVATLLIAPIVSDLIQNLPIGIEPAFPFNYIYDFYYYSIVVPAESPKELWGFLLTLVNAPAMSYLLAITGTILYLTFVLAILTTVVMSLYEKGLFRVAVALYLTPLVIAILWGIGSSFI